VTPQEVQERLRVSFDRAGAFLRLSALLAALLAGIAIALSARRYARRKIDEIALLRALGASRGFAFGGLSLTLAMPSVIAAIVGAGLALGLASAAFAFAHGLLPPSAQDVPLPLGPAFAAVRVALGVLALESGTWKLAGVLAATLAGAAVFALAVTAALLWLIRKQLAR